MKMRLLMALGLLAGISSCKEADSVVVVNVSINSDVQPVYSLRVAMSTARTHDTKTYPANASKTPMPSSASFAIVLPRSRAGLLDLALDGLDIDGKSVAYGTTQTAIIVGGTVPVSVVLAAGASLCGNGLIDPGETCDDGDQFSFDGCDFRCQAEGSGQDAAFPDSAVTDEGRTDAFLQGPPDAARAESTADSTVSPDLPGDTPTTGSDLGLDQGRDFGGDFPQIKADAPTTGKDGPSETAANPSDAAYDASLVIDVLPPPPDARVDQVDSSAGNPFGQACTTNDQCASGYCTDGVCCQGPCASVCMVCNLPTSLGQCSMVSAGQDPRDSCPQDLASTCGRDGTCDGSGGCRRWANGTTCASATCVSGTASAARTCDGAGACRPAVNTSCLPYACAGSTCTTQCAGSSDCDANAWCNGTKCQVRVGIGGTCSSDQECVLNASCRMSVSNPGWQVCSGN